MQAHAAVILGRPHATSVVEGEAATVLVDLGGFREDVADGVARVIEAVQGVDFLAVSVRESERVEVRPMLGFSLGHRK